MCFNQPDNLFNTTFKCPFYYFNKAGNALLSKEGDSVIAVFVYSTNPDTLKKEKISLNLMCVLNRKTIMYFFEIVKDEDEIVKKKDKTKRANQLFLLSKLNGISQIEKEIKKHEHTYFKTLTVRFMSAEREDENKHIEMMNLEFNAYYSQSRGVTCQPLQMDVGGGADKMMRNFEKYNNDGHAICNKCAKAGTHLKRCSRCRMAYYCSEKCQKADWKNHKETFCDRFARIEKEKKKK